MSGISFETPIELDEGDTVEVEIDAEGGERIWVVRADGSREHIPSPKREHPLFTDNVTATYVVRRE